MRTQYASWCLHNCLGPFHERKTVQHARQERSSSIGQKFYPARLTLPRLTVHPAHRMGTAKQNAWPKEQKQLHAVAHSCPAHTHAPLPSGPLWVCLQSHCLSPAEAALGWPLAQEPPHQMLQQPGPCLQCPLSMLPVQTPAQESGARCPSNQALSTARGGPGPALVLLGLQTIVEGSWGVQWGVHWRRRSVAARRCRHAACRPLPCPPPPSRPAAGVACEHDDEL